MYPIPKNEDERLATLRELQIMDTLPEKEYDNITHLVSYICEVPIALVTLLDDKRQWFKSNIGLSVSESPRNQAFCSYTIAQDSQFIVEDALHDERFKCNALVVGNPDIRFYAGSPIRSGNKPVG